MAVIKRFLSLFTFLPMPEIKALEQVSGADLNGAKAILAFETTALVHGRQAVIEAHFAAAAAFGPREIPERMLPASRIPREKTVAAASTLPTTRIALREITDGIPAYQLFVRTGLTKSAGEARRLIGQNGAYINEKRVSVFDLMINPLFLLNGEIILRAGKKRYHWVEIDG